MNLKQKLKSIMSANNCARPLAGINLSAWPCRNCLAAKACAIFNPTSKHNSINPIISTPNRLRAKAVYREEERRYADNSKGILSDQVIQLSSAHAIKRGAPTLRRMGYRDATTGKVYEFLTNNFKLAAATIAAIYKDRWQVEGSSKRSSKT